MNKYNKRLAEILKEKGLNIRKLSILTGIGPSTLYSIMDRDTRIRYDYAIKIAKVLDISASEICEEAKIFENIHTDDDFSMFLSPNINKIINKASESEMKQIIELLENYYMLDDDAREQIFEQIKLMKKQQDRKNKEQ